jgi:hemoglobin/transferrin/lactoferrin receptor protein
MRIFQLALLQLMLLGVHLTAFGQGNSDSTHKVWDEMKGSELTEPEVNLRDKVVSASRSERSIKDLPVTIHVITGEEIRKNGYTTLAEALKSVSGFMVSRPGSGTEGELFLMRGFVGNYYSKILINNIPVQPSVVSGMPINEQIPIRHANRIEVIYGPASSVYGADALAGVINIIMDTPEEAATAQADMTVGQFGYKNINFNAGGKFGYDRNLVKYSFYGIYGEREKLNIEHHDEVFNPQLYAGNTSFLSYPNYVGTATMPAIGNLPCTARAMGMQVKWRGFTLNADRMYRRDASSIGLITNFYNYYSNDIFYGENITRYALNYATYSGRWAFVTNLSWLKYRMDNETSFKFNFEAGQNGRVFKYAASDDIFAEQLITYKPNAHIELTTGLTATYSGNLPKTNDLNEPFLYADYRAFSRNINLNDPLFGKFGYNPIVYNNVATFLQGFYSRNSFSAIVGFRYDVQSIYGSRVNPRVALLYKINEKLLIRSYTGTAFRAPSPYYSYNSVAVPTDVPGSVFYLQIPNPKLAPERFTATEFALRYDIRKNFNIEAVVFYQQIRGQIYNTNIALDPALYPNTTQTTAGAYVNDSGNNEGANLSGLQLKAQFYELFAPYRLGGNVGLMLSKGKERLPDGNTVISEFRQMPRVLGQIELHGNPTKNLYLQTICVFTSSWYARDILERIASKTDLTVKGYFVADILARYQISKHLSVFTKVQNLFDAAFAGIGATGSSLDLRYNPQLGRNVQAGVSIRTH